MARCSRTLQLERGNSFCSWRTFSQHGSRPSHNSWSKPEQYLCLQLFSGSHMHVDYILLQKGVDLCRSFNIVESTTALSHLGKQVIAISIIYCNIQWSGPQTILTSRLTKINGAAHKQAYPPPPPPIPLSRLHLFLFSTPPIICFLLHSRYHLLSLPVVFISQDLFLSFCSLAFIYQPRTRTNTWAQLLTPAWPTKLFTFMQVGLEQCNTKRKIWLKLVKIYPS